MPETALRHVDRFRQLFQGILLRAVLFHHLDRAADLERILSRQGILRQTGPQEQNQHAHEFEIGVFPPAGQPECGFVPNRFQNRDQLRLGLFVHRIDPGTAFLPRKTEIEQVFITGQGAEIHMRMSDIQQLGIEQNIIMMEIPDIGVTVNGPIRKQKHISRMDRFLHVAVFVSGRPAADDHQFAEIRMTMPLVRIGTVFRHFHIQREFRAGEKPAPAQIPLNLDFHFFTFP